MILQKSFYDGLVLKNQKNSYYYWILKTYFMGGNCDALFSKDQKNSIYMKYNYFVNYKDLNIISDQMNKMILLNLNFQTVL